MKQGRRPNRQQKQLIRASGLNPLDWLVSKNLEHEGEIHLVQRYTEKGKVLYL